MEIASGLRSCYSASSIYSDSVEREDTLMDNSVQLQSFVQYEPDLFVSRCVCAQHQLNAIY